MAVQHHWQKSVAHALFAAQVDVLEERPSNFVADLVPYVALKLFPGPVVDKEDVLLTAEYLLILNKEIEMLPLDKVYLTFSIQLLVERDAAVLSAGARQSSEDALPFCLLLGKHFSQSLYEAVQIALCCSCPLLRRGELIL